MMGFAKTISFLLGPVFILFPVPFILVSRFNQDFYYALRWAVFSYAFLLVIAAFVFLGVLFGFFTNFDVSKREQRPLLFAFSAFIMLCYLISLVLLEGPRILFLALFSIILGLITIVIINKWIKVSIHLATATSVILLAVVVYGGYFYLFFGLIPLLAWSRIKMKEHTLLETIIGSILGVVLTSIIYIISKQFFLGMIYNQ
jgi:hypothetical protein